MKKLWLIALVFTLSACSSGPNFAGGVQEDSYEPMVIGEEKDINMSTIYAPEDVYFTEVNSSKLKGIKYLRIGLSGFPNSISIKPGKHSFKLWKDGNPDFDLTVRNMNLEEDKEYFVNYITKQDGNYVQIYYWVENIADGMVVYGKKFTKEELSKNNL